jgi:hypothetical protein
MPKDKGAGNEHAHKKAIELYYWIEDYQGEHGYSPSRLEIAGHWNTSTSIADYYLNYLVNIGALKPWPKGLARVLVLLPLPKGEKDEQE